MKERPIIFSADMVTAILRGDKTQTRRVVKPQPPHGCYYAVNGNRNKACCLFASSDIASGVICVPPTPSSKDHLLPCPYGKIGDRLWVREAAWYRTNDDRACFTNGDIMAKGWGYILYRASQPYIDGELKEFGWKKRSPIHMPRWASRITLEITNLRVERLQDISEEDARAEGAKEMTVLPGDCGSFVPDFAMRWDGIHGAGSWTENPWVWVITFRKVNQ